MSEVNINYKGTKIAGMDASGTKTLLTDGKYCEDDIEVVYTRPTIPTPSYQSKTKSYTPSETAQSEIVTADSGYDGLSQVAVSVGAVSSTYVGSEITRRSSSDLTASGATVTVPSGYYSSQASKVVSSGSAGTPTATKGTVSNHSVSVTPSVTNTTGYITGSTKTGTAVTVSASELVSGSQTFSDNGDYDVTNLASVTVSVSGGGGGSVTQDANGYIVLPSTGGGSPSSNVPTFTITYDSDYETITSVNCDKTFSQVVDIVDNDGIEYALVIITNGSEEATTCASLYVTSASSFIYYVSGSLPYLKITITSSNVVTVTDADNLVTLNVTSNGTYTPNYGEAYNNVVVNVSGGATQHTIHLEFSDSTDTDINVYYDDSLIGTMITAYSPSTWTYSSKTVYVAELDGVEWYNATPSPITWVTLINDSSYVSPNGDGTGYIYLPSLSSTQIQDDSQWRVTLDGYSYVATARYYSQIHTNGIPHYNSNNVNDAILYNNGSAWIIYLPLQDSGQVSFKIEYAT